MLSLACGDPQNGRRLVLNRKVWAPMQPPSVRAKERLAIHALRTRFLQLLHLNNDNQPSKYAITHPSTSVCSNITHYYFLSANFCLRAAHHLVPPKPKRWEVISVRMTKMLKKACTRLNITEPIYRSMMNNTHHGRRLHRHLVAVVPPGSSEAIVSEGRFAYDAAVSKEDCARLCIRHLCRAVDGYVYDYNFDLVLRWKERYLDLARELGATQARLEEVERYKDALRNALYNSGRTAHSSQEATHPLDEDPTV
ncbi:hypothetical protein S245_037405 [Arachis hypogaea]|nr:uncharacterized protein DS421_11g337150 [Arachis hypogaea]